MSDVTDDQSATTPARKVPAPLVVTRRQIWITAHSLKTGIILAIADVHGDKFALVPGRPKLFSRHYRFSLEEALAQFENLKRRRIAALKRELARLERFEAPVVDDIIPETSK